MKTNSHVFVLMATLSAGSWGGAFGCGGGGEYANSPDNPGGTQMTTGKSYLELANAMCDKYAAARCKLPPNQQKSLENCKKGAASESEAVLKKSAGCQAKALKMQECMASHELVCVGQPVQPANTCAPQIQALKECNSKAAANQEQRGGLTQEEIEKVKNNQRQICENAGKTNGCANSKVFLSYCRSEAQLPPDFMHRSCLQAEIALSECAAKPPFSCEFESAHFSDDRCQSLIADFYKDKTCR